MTRPRVAVAYSGGRDSTALLHATLVAAEMLEVDVVALHVHHGLSARADAWLAHCEQQCREWAARWPRLAFAATRLTHAPPRGASVEAWARSARYDALRGMALEHGADLVLLGQHRRDQAETLLLQALRGGGVHALAGMPRTATRGGVAWARPWLEQPREAIEQYLASCALRHVDDDSNDDPRFARNRLRRSVWPALGEAFPGAEAALAKAAGWAAEAAAVLDEVAAADVARVADGDAIDLARWRALSPARRSLVLRTWLAAQAGRTVPRSLRLRLLGELATDRVARWTWGPVELRSYRGRLRLVSADEPGAPPEQVAGERAGSPVSPAEPAAAPVSLLRCATPGRYAVPAWRGVLVVESVDVGGVAAERLEALELRARIGAERFQLGPAQPPRALKKQYQARGIPAWERSGPLVYSAGALIFVPGLGIDARALSPPGVEQYALGWLPQSAI